MAENVKIFMCIGKETDLVPPLCVPVQGGAKINSPISGIIEDDGKNGSISEKNPYYCELTVQYYAWKNEDADYYGLCHYRRFFCFDKSIKKPYLAFKGTLPEKKKHLLGDEDEIRRLCGEYDVIVPRAENVGKTVYQKYVTSKHCFKEDLDLFLEILKEKYPFLSEYADAYMSQSKQYFCNMFIMKRELFFEYSELLFSLLEELDLKKTLHGSFQDDRTDGYLGERFLGIYIYYLLSKGKRICEISRIDINCGAKRTLLYKLFPPETKRRFLLKKIWHS